MTSIIAQDEPNTKFSQEALDTIALAASIGLTSLQNEPARLSLEVILNHVKF